MENNVEYLKLNEKYAISSDGKLNLLLLEFYEKRTGAGKNAPLSGEIGFQTVGYFGAGLHSLIRRFNNDEFLETFAEVERGQDIIEALKEMRTYLDEREKRIYEHVKEHVTLNLKNTKDVNAD